MKFVASLSIKKQLNPKQKETELPNQIKMSDTKWFLKEDKW